MEVCHVTYSATTFTWRLVGLPIKTTTTDNRVLDLQLAKSQFRNEFSIPTGKKVAFARAYVATAGCAHVDLLLVGHLSLDGLHPCATPGWCWLQLHLSHTPCQMLIEID